MSGVFWEYFVCFFAVFGLFSWCGTLFLSFIKIKKIFKIIFFYHKGYKGTQRKITVIKIIIKIKVQTKKRLPISEQPLLFLVTMKWLVKFDSVIFFFGFYSFLIFFAVELKLNAHTCCIIDRTYLWKIRILSTHNLCI